MRASSKKNKIFKIFFNFFFFYRYIFVYVERFDSFHLHKWCESYEAHCFVGDLCKFLRKQCDESIYKLNFNDCSKKGVGHGLVCFLEQSHLCNQCGLEVRRKGFFLNNARIESIVHFTPIFEAICVNHSRIEWDVHIIVSVGILKYSMLLTPKDQRVFWKSKDPKLPIFDALSKFYFILNLWIPIIKKVHYIVKAMCGNFFSPFDHLDW